jgi:hypothetical protein
MKKLLIATIIILMFGGASQKISAQDFSVRIFPLTELVQKEAKKLEKFYIKEDIIKRYDANKKVVFIMKCCSDNTLSIYFPSYDKVTGERIDCCPVLTLFGRDEKYFTADTPFNGETYNKKETEEQIKIINRALELLCQNQTSKN